MGVDKTKVVGGKTRHLLRFICNLTPLNAFMRKIEGDCKTLPQAVFVGRIVLSSQEYLVFDGEDLQSSFNLFLLPASWLGFFAFDKMVDASALGGPAGTMTYVSVRVVPMGWTTSVGIIQNFIRNFTYKICNVSPSLELHGGKPVPQGDAAITCMDGFDLLTRVQLDSKVFKLACEELDASAVRSPVMERFVAECQVRNLPLNEGKSVIRRLNTAILGGRAMECLVF